MNQTVAIFGATGAQGAPVVQEALANGLTVRAVARDVAKISEMHSEAQAYAATLDDVDAIARALNGVDAAFLHLPAPANPEDPQTWMTAFFTAAHQVNLPLLVFTTGGTTGDRYPSSIMIDATTGGMRAVLNSGIPSIVLQPTIYLENFLPGFLTPRLQSEGVLDYPPLPETMKVTWTSHFDQARVAVAALTRPDLAGQSFEIGTPAPLTGGQLAELLAGWVDRPVSFVPQTAAALGAQVAEAFGNPGMGHMLTDMYGTLATMGDDDMCIDTQLVEETFGVTLTTVADHIKSWGKAAAAA
ncbi:SDR family oxidoreductase [Shimia sp.]|jgi:uncharacterized protein YbjT (DUF2867 family)|uniref:SDR family oxidoreductase n=1 Tax=unclassified Shimia TaxID=2630038 RepID=UPI0025DCE962|nr:NmrA family NAD(P)-binding protein [Shimia sp.]MCH2066426.1 NAD(P)H-binding protein [Shimia sp.]